MISLPVKARNSMNGDVLRMDFGRFCVGITFALLVQIMRQQGSVFSSLVKGDANSGERDQRDDPKNPIHPINMGPHGPFFKIGAPSC